MRVNQAKVEELARSWINGNKGFVRKEVKKLTKLEFYFLVSNIGSHSNDEEEQTACRLVGDF